MRWHLSHHASKRGCKLADRHYSRKTVGSPQFTPPGRKLVLMTAGGDALWVTTWPFTEYVKHAWAGCWMCCLFRNESLFLASELITEAVAATRAYYGEPPPLGMVSFIDPNEVKPTMVRGQAVLGWTWRKAGFEAVGVTAGGLYAFQLLPEKMPGPRPPRGYQRSLLEVL